MKDNHIFTFPPLNANWTYFAAPSPKSVPKCHYIPEGILTCTYVKMSTVSTQFTAFKTWKKLHTSNYAFSCLFLLHNCSFPVDAFDLLLHYSVQYSEFKARIAGTLPPFIKMHQFPFVHKFPGLTSTSFPPLPLTIQVTLSGEKWICLRPLTTCNLKLVHLRRLSAPGTEVGFATKSTKFCAVLPRNITRSH